MHGSNFPIQNLSSFNITVYDKKYKIYYGNNQMMNSKCINLETAINYMIYARRINNFFHGLVTPTKNYLKNFRKYEKREEDEFRPVDFDFRTITGFYDKKVERYNSNYWFIHGGNYCSYVVEQIGDEEWIINQPSLNSYQIKEIVGHIWSATGVVVGGRVIIFGNKIFEGDNYEKVYEEYVSYMSASIECSSLFCWNRVFFKSKCMSCYIKKIKKTQKKIKNN